MCLPPGRREAKCLDARVAASPPRSPENRTPPGLAFDLTGGEGSDGGASKPCSTSNPTFSPAPLSATKATPARPTGTRRGSAASLKSFPTKPTKGASLFLRPHSLQALRAHRAGRRTAQALQASRAALRKDRSKLQINRLLRRRLMLDQIRPRGLSRVERLILRMAGKSAVRATPEEVRLLEAKAGGSDRAEADRARSILLAKRGTPRHVTSTSLGGQADRPAAHVGGLGRLISSLPDLDRRALTIS
jgi:hypothetical protein